MRREQRWVSGLLHLRAVTQAADMVVGGAHRRRGLAAAATSAALFATLRLRITGSPLIQYADLDGLLMIVKAYIELAVDSHDHIPPEKKAIKRLRSRLRCQAMG